MAFQRWSKWRRFPDPRKGQLLVAPLGAGCYQLRYGQLLVLFGIGRNVAQRLTSLLPAPLGSGTRNNDRKRRYVLKHLGKIEYRTRATVTRHDAAEYERSLKNVGDYLFPT